MAEVSYFAQLVLRLVVIALTFAAAIIMVTSQQTKMIGVIPVGVRYTDSPSLRFNVVADCAVCCLSVFALGLLISLNRPKSNPSHYFYLLLNDMISLILVVSGCSAAMAIGYVGKFGIKPSGWRPICDNLSRFCDKATSSLAACFVAMVCCFVLTLMSAHKLDSYNTNSNSNFVRASN